VSNETIGSVPALPSETATEAAQPNAATTLPETDDGAGGEQQSGTPKTFSQQELDEIVKKRVAKAEDRAERRVLRTLEKLQPQAAPQPTARQAPESDKPTRRDGEADDSYLERLADWKLDQRDQRQAQHQHMERQTTLAQKTDKLYADAEKLSGFDREAFDELPLTKSIVEALVDSDTPAKLMHYMAANPAEVERISKLSPARQAAELGKLEAKLPSTPRTSKAPDPIGDPTAKASTTTTPSDPSRMNPEQYREFRKRTGARWAQ
jgi:hypothetical protein